MIHTVGDSYKILVAHMVFAFGLFVALYLLAYILIYYVMGLRSVAAISITYGVDFLCGAIAHLWFYKRSGRGFNAKEMFVFGVLCFLLFFALGVIEVSFQRIDIPFAMAVSELVFVMAAILRIIGHPKPPSAAAR